MAIVPRENLYSFFETGDIPTQEEFADLIDSYVHQKEDGVSVYKPDAENKRFGVGVLQPPYRLGVRAEGDIQKLISLHDIEDTHRWSINLNPSISANTGLNIAQETAGGSISRLFVQESTGNVGIGSQSPQQKLHIENNAPASLSGIKVLNSASVANNGWLIGHLNDEETQRDGSLSFRSQVDDPIERMLINSDGNVGINEPLPYTKLHVSMPNSDPNAVIGLSENTGIVNVGPITENIVMDFRGLQARTAEFIGDVISMDVAAMNLQRLGGDILIHGDDTIEVSRKVMITDEGLMGLGTITPVEKLEIDGAVKIGDTEGLNEGTIRWTGADFEGYNGTSWLSFTSGGEGQWTQGEGNHIYYNPEVPLGVSIGTDVQKATLTVANQEVAVGSSAASIVSNVSTNASAGAGDNRVGLLLESSGEWGGELSAVIGLYVNSADGHQFANHNLAAVVNGNLVVGDVSNEGSSVGTNGSRVLAIQPGVEPTAEAFMGGVQLYVRSIDGHQHLGIMDGDGNVVTLFQQPALVPAENDAFSATYDASVIDILNNMRTRINELESKIAELGLFA